MSVNFSKAYFAPDFFNPDIMSLRPEVSNPTGLVDFLADTTYKTALNNSMHNASTYLYDNAAITDLSIKNRAWINNTNPSKFYNQKEFLNDYLKYNNNLDFLANNGTTINGAEFQEPGIFENGLNDGMQTLSDLKTSYFGWGAGFLAAGIIGLGYTAYNFYKNKDNIDKKLIAESVVSGTGGLASLIGGSSFLTSSLNNSWITTSNIGNGIYTANTLNAANYVSGWGWGSSSLSFLIGGIGAGIMGAYAIYKAVKYFKNKNPSKNSEIKTKIKDKFSGLGKKIKPKFSDFKNKVKTKFLGFKEKIKNKLKKENNVDSNQDTNLYLIPNADPNDL